MPHCNTIFHQMLKLIPRHHFGKLETEHGTGRKARSFTRWSQLAPSLPHPVRKRPGLRFSLTSGIRPREHHENLLFLRGCDPARFLLADYCREPASWQSGFCHISLIILISWHLCL
jgi:hypothetical protein